jgi:putative membrane protein
MPPRHIAALAHRPHHTFQSMTIVQRIKLFLKGMAMGAADVVPGVSGGTIAFISGIYEELLSSIKSLGPDTLVTLRRDGITAAWRQVNGSFLITLFAGIGTSVLLLVRPITWAIAHKPVLIWSFFFGLIAASVWLCGRLVKHWSLSAIVGLTLGTAVAVVIGLLNAGAGSDALWFVFLSGAIAICAMILPGISGSFILLLMGMYLPVMTALKTFNIPVIVVFALGCLFGLMAFSRLLSWMFARHHDLTVSSLTGFLLGSLFIIWPWKAVVSVRMVHEGRPDAHLEPFIQRNIWPQDYATITELDTALGISQKDPQIMLAALLALVGVVLLVVLERFAPEK